MHTRVIRPKIAALMASCLVPLVMTGCGAVPRSGSEASQPRQSAGTPTSVTGSVLASCAMASAPPGRIAASLAFEPPARRFLLFGGDVFPNGGAQSIAETWLWNGLTWVSYAGAGPSARAYAVMDRDALGNLILYGGQNDVAGQPVVNLFDMWVWDGAHWSAHSAATVPMLRFPVGVYDAAHANLVVFGIGKAGPETWLWNGSQWNQALPAHSPFPREDEAIAYLSGPSQVVLFGGYASGLGVVNDTWLWDGTDWHNPQLASIPPGRLSATFVGGQDAILFGGSKDTTSFLGDTWRWDGTAWTQLHPLHAPPARIRSAFASDGQYPVVVGGLTPATSLATDAWRWGGTDWTECT